MDSRAAIPIRASGNMFKSNGRGVLLIEKLCESNTASAADGSDGKRPDGVNRTARDGSGI